MLLKICGNRKMARHTDYYSGIAAGYDELHGAEQDEKLREFLGKVTLPACTVLLDVGCGTGRSALLLNVDWQGIEPSPGLIAQAPASIRTRITIGSAEQLPYPDGHFDAVLSLTALQNFSDPAKGLAEMGRVSKREAIILISFLKKSPKAERLDALIRERLIVDDSWEQSKDMMYICKPSKYI